jgi:hypothetical protein
MKNDTRETMARRLLDYQCPPGKKPARQLGGQIVTPQCDPEHYKAGNIETIDVLEDFVSIENRKLTPRQKYDVSQALKYLLRVGLKGSSEVDLQKAENYIHRALTGEWIDPVMLVIK